MELFSVVLGGSMAIAMTACPREMTQAGQRFYARYLQQESASQPLPLETVIKSNQAVLAPALYRDLLAASMRKPGGGGAYLDFDPFFGNQVRTFAVSLAGCSMLAADRGLLEITKLSGLSRSRASSSCLRVEMVKQAGDWRIKDVLMPSEPEDQAAGSPAKCGPGATYSKLSQTLRLILAN